MDIKDAINKNNEIIIFLFCEIIFITVFQLERSYLICEICSDIKPSKNMNMPIIKRNIVNSVYFSVKMNTLYIKCQMPNPKNIILSGINIRNGENNVAIFNIMTRKRTPSMIRFILLFPTLLLTMIGTYFILNPLRNKAKVIVDGYENVFGNKYKNFIINSFLMILYPEVKSMTLKWVR